MLGKIWCGFSWSELYYTDSTAVAAPLFHPFYLPPSTRGSRTHFEIEMHKNEMVPLVISERRYLVTSKRSTIFRNYMQLNNLTPYTSNCNGTMSSAAFTIHPPSPHYWFICAKASSQTTQPTESKMRWRETTNNAIEITEIRDGERERGEKIVIINII